MPLPLPSPTPAPAGPTHVGVRCDVCATTPIRGIRYRCTVCADYDLCATCEEVTGAEHGHPLLKIRRPASTGPTPTPTPAPILPGPVPPPPSGGGSQPGSWICSACTYENSTLGGNSCVMCGTLNPNTPVLPTPQPRIVSYQARASAAPPPRRPVTKKTKMARILGSFTRSSSTSSPAPAPAPAPAQEIVCGTCSFANDPASDLCAVCLTSLTTQTVDIPSYLAGEPEDNPEIFAVEDD